MSIMESIGNFALGRWDADEDDDRITGEPKSYGANCLQKMFGCVFYYGL